LRALMASIFRARVASRLELHHRQWLFAQALMFAPPMC
jgi:hypothetical protein